MSRAGCAVRPPPRPRRAPHSTAPPRHLTRLPRPAPPHAGVLRGNAAPVSAKVLLQKLPPRVYRRLEELVGSCAHLDWKHFDAGVVKVLGQLARIAEADVLEELALLESSDLSNIQNYPAYLNKRLNNRLWSRRKSDNLI